MIALAETAMPSEFTRTTLALRLLDEKIQAAKANIASLQSRFLPVVDAEQALLVLLEARRMLELELRGIPIPKPT